MRNYIFAAATAATALIGSMASAATLGLTTDTPEVFGSSALVDFLDDAPDSDLSSFGSLVDDTTDVTLVGDAFISFAFGFSLADPTGDFAGGFDILDDNGEVLGGNLLAVGFTEDEIELQFGSLSGSAAGSFGTSVLAFVTFDDPIGANPFDAFSDGDSLTAQILIQNVVEDTPVNPVPLPAGLPLLIGGLGALSLIRRTRRA